MEGLMPKGCLWVRESAGVEGVPGRTGAASELAQALLRGKERSAEEASARCEGLGGNTQNKFG